MFKMEIVFNRNTNKVLLHYITIKWYTSFGFQNEMMKYIINRKLFLIINQ